MIKKKTTKELVDERPKPEEIAKLPRTPISIVVDNVRSLDNVGLLFRLCEVARIEKLYLTGYTGHPKIEGDERPKEVIERHEKRINKTAVYALPYQPWEYVESAVELVKKLKAKGNQIIALEQTTGSAAYNLPPTPYNLPAVIIVGHERQGVSEDLLKLADQIVDIPILGIGNSHNVAIATGIVLYHILEKTGQI